MNINPFCAGGLYPAQPWPYGPGCDCCDASACAECNIAANDSPDHPTRPCCSGGNCSQCQCISGDIPWLMPKAVGCGRIHRCADTWNDAPLPPVGSPNSHVNLILTPNTQHPNLSGQLDGNRLPGRPPHTITCVHAMGIHSWARNPAIAGYDCGSANSNVRVDGYDMLLNIEIPIELIVRDCCGYQYCLRSYIQDEIRIPLCVQAAQARDTSDFLFLKSRVRLCSPYSVPAGSSENYPSAPIVLGGDNLRLELLAEACVVKLVPYGVLGFDPYSCQPPKYN